MAMWVMAVVAAAPCQCFSPGGIQTTSPGRISSTGPPQRRTRPQPAVTIRVWPSGWVCHAVRAPGSKVTWPPLTRAGSGAWNSGSTRTDPVNQSGDPLAEGREPFRLISISISELLRCTIDVSALALIAENTAIPVEAAITCRREYGDIVTGASSRQLPGRPALRG